VPLPWTYPYSPDLEAVKLDLHMSGEESSRSTLLEMVGHSRAEWLHLSSIALREVVEPNPDVCHVKSQCVFRFRITGLSHLHLARGCPVVLEKVVADKTSRKLRSSGPGFPEAQRHEEKETQNSIPSPPCASRAAA
jgi:hypothetical protein